MLKNYFFFFLFICYGSYAQQTKNSYGNFDQIFIENKKLSKNISLYPNPVEDVLRVHAKDVKITKIEIYYSIGGKIMNIQSNFNAIYLGDLPRGIYLIKIYSGKNYTVKKLIKK